MRTIGIGRLVAIVVVSGLAVFGAATAPAAQAGVFGEEPPPSVVVNELPPEISGTPVVGNTLSCSTGSWVVQTLGLEADGWSYAYQWKRDGADIAGATSNGYTVTGDDVGKQITCTVQASYTGATPASATSAPVTGQAPASGGSTPGTGDTSPGGGSQPVALPAASKVVELPSNSRCASKRTFRIRVRRIAGVTYLKVEVYVNGKKVKTVQGDRVTAPVDLRSLPKGKFAAKIVVTTTDGRTVSHSRKYRTCSKRRPGKKHKL